MVELVSIQSRGTDIEVNVWSYIAMMTTRRSFPGEQNPKNYTFTVSQNHLSRCFCA